MVEQYEDFTKEQLKILEQFVSNTTSNIFVLRNLPEVIKGALFSRYSRSCLGLRSLLLKDFILNEETAFDSIVGEKDKLDKNRDNQLVAIKRAQNFYDRILDGYGDDSIGELGGAHLAIENISMIAAKEIEDCRIGGSPLEKSTRYIYFDQKINGEYQYHLEPTIMTSAYKQLYIETCDLLFDTYRKLIPPLTEAIEKTFPKEEGTSDGAYRAALRAKVLDCLRGLLPASAHTNMGVFGNGRFFETLIQKLNAKSLSEMQNIGKKTYAELNKVIPSFIRRSEVSHKYQKTFTDFQDNLKGSLQDLSEHFCVDIKPVTNGFVRLNTYTQEAPKKLAAALLFPHVNASYEDLLSKTNALSDEDIEKILHAACENRQNRRHKSPRALEHIFFTFEISADFGVYRDLQRHRMLTQERQLLSCHSGYYTPKEIIGTSMQPAYEHAMNEAKACFDKIAMELPEEAQYVVPMAYNIHWYFHVNLRALQWLCELRSQPAGHPTYRYIAQEMASQVIQTFPEFKNFFKFVDFEGYDLGRLGQEVRNEQKQQARIQ